MATLRSLARVGFLVIPIVVILSATGWAQAPATNAKAKKKTAPQPVRAASGVRVEADVAYLGPERKEALDVYVPADAKDGQVFPLVVDIHGGGFTGGDKADRREQHICNTLAQRGYVCASINYFMPQQDQLSGFPKNIHDCKTAVRFMRANATKYHVDPKHAAAIGGSAGGYFASILALTKDGDALDPKGPYGDVSCELQAAVDLYGPVDFLADPSTAEGTNLVGFLKRVQGQWSREQLELYSPSEHVSGAPPMLVTHGGKDVSVAMSQSQRFVDRLKKAGATCYFYRIPGGAHSYDLQSSGTDLRDTVAGFFDRYLKGKDVTIPDPKPGEGRAGK